MNNRAKRRSPQQLTDEKGIALLKDVMPENWVLREYRPDYGLDFAVEVFEGSNNEYPQTLGEHFFIQLKSTNSPIVKPFKIFSRKNIEKQKENFDKAEFESKDTYRFSLETSELITVERMGTGVPVLLVIADLKIKKCFFVCLNDYIDKILIPRHKNYRASNHRTIHIPCENDISTNFGKIALRWYAKRAKLFSAFNRFNYQYSELRHQEMGDWKTLAAHFASRIKDYDFWDDIEMCPKIQHYGTGIRNLVNTGKPNLVKQFESPDEANYSQQEVEYVLEKFDVFSLWQGLSSLSNNYEDIWREWFLPTHLGHALSSPEMD